jgi:hypothetical protein
LKLSNLSFASIFIAVKFIISLIMFACEPSDYPDSDRKRVALCNIPIKVAMLSFTLCTFHIGGKISIFDWKINEHVLCVCSLQRIYVFACNIFWTYRDMLQLFFWLHIGNKEIQHVHWLHIPLALSFELSLSLVLLCFMLSTIHSSLAKVHKKQWNVL